MHLTGRDIDDLTIAADVICCPHPDRDVAMRRAKLHVGFYVAHPVSDVVAELLIPIADRDEERVAELLVTYRAGL